MNDQQSPLQHYLRVLKRGGLMVLIAVVLTTEAAIFYSLRQQHLYRASAEVFLGTQDLIAALSNVQIQYVDAARQAETQSDFARTAAVVKRAARIAHIPGRNSADLFARSTVATSVNSDVLTFSVTDPDPAVAPKLATAYAQAYTRYRLEVDTKALVRVRAEIRQRLDELAAEGRQNGAVYANLSAKDQQLRTMELLQSSKSLLIGPAGGAARIQPRPARNGVLGAVLGLGLGIGLAFLLDALNTRVRTATEVQERLDLPLLARIPKPPRGQRGTARLAMLTDPHGPEAESYRILATNLDFVNVDRQARTIMVTSAQRAEGKSTTASNLAIALARTGRRVALIDLDLRLPALARFFDLENRTGLAQVVLGRAALEEALVRIPVQDDHPLGPASNGSGGGSLEVLPTGPLPPNPAEFSDSHALSDVLRALEKRVDIVLVDAPPILAVSDAVKLSRKVDAVIVLARLALIKRPALDELRRVLEAAPTAKLGVVVTGSSDEGSGYGYGYGYGYGSARRSGETRRERELVR